MILLHTPTALPHFTQNSSTLHKPTLNCPLYYAYPTSKLNHDSVLLAPPNPFVSDLLTQKHQVSPQVASRVASALTHVDNPENLDSVISFLKDNGFSKPQLERVIRSWPEMLVADLDRTIKPKFNFFKDFGFTPSEIVGIFSKEPWILESSLSNRIAPALPVLYDLLGSHAEVVKLLMTSGWFLKSDLEKTLVPNIEYLMRCGVRMVQIRRFLYGYSRFFLVKPEEMRQFVEKADRLGADRSSGMFLQAVKVVGSMSEEAWERKMQGFRELGYSEDDIQMIFKKAPNVLAASLEKVNRIIEALLSTGKYTMESIISHPMALTYSFEKRYRPRLSVLQVLESKNLIKEWPGLTVLYSMTDGEFFERYVAPHLNESVDSSGGVSQTAEVL